MVTVNKVTFYWKVEKFWISLPQFVWVIKKGMQSFKKIYSVVMKLNRFFALHFFANGYKNIIDSTEVAVMFVIVTKKYINCDA